MILQLGMSSEFIKVTAAYSNAVMAAMLPHFTDFARKLDLPVPVPITAASVFHCGVLPYTTLDGSMAGGSVILTNGYSFSFQFGYVNGFSRPHTYYGLQDPDMIPRFFGTVRMSKEEAVQMARDVLLKLDIPLESVFAEQAPKVKSPPKIGTNVVPRYQVIWLDPRGGDAGAVRMEINADAKRLEGVVFHAKSLERPPPRVGVAPLSGTGDGTFFRSDASPKINPAYVEKLIPIMLLAIGEYARKYALPIPVPLTTNHVARITVNDNGGWPHCQIELTNGWRFIYRNNMVNGWYASDNLFNSDDRPIRIEEFTGKRNMTEQEAVELVKRRAAKMNYPTNLLHLDFPPHVNYANGSFSEIIPRCWIEWWCENAAHSDLEFKLEAEVDMEKRELKSFYFDNKAFFRHPPPIDVPISLPAAPSPPGPPAKDAGTRPRAQAAPPPPFEHLVPPR